MNHHPGSTNMVSFTYSPIGPEGYTVPLKKVCVATVHLDLPRPDAIWNLIWLSLPRIDELMGRPKEWVDITGFLCSKLKFVVDDVCQDDDLADMLTKHPSEFAAWFSAEDHTIYDCYDGIGPSWPETVLSRAEEACRRIMRPVDVVKFVNGAVVIDFKAALKARGTA